MKLSVIIPTYKSARYIAKAVQSVLDQRVNFEYEILVRDDFSQDGSEEILRELARKNQHRIKWFPGKANWGAIRNIEYLRRRTLGQYVAYLDGDDYYTDNNVLQHQVDFLDSHPGFVMHSMGYDTVNEDDEFLWKVNGDDPYFTHPSFPIITMTDVLLWNYVTFARMWRNIGVDMEWAKDAYFYDWAFNFEMMKHGIVYGEDIVAGSYRYTQNGMITSMPQEEVDRRNESFRLILKQRYDEYAASMPEPLLLTRLPEEMYAQQTWHVTEVFPKVLPLFDLIIEIGTLAGAFTDWLSMYVKDGCRIISYDIQPKLRVARDKPNIEYRAGDCMTDEIANELRNTILTSGRTLVLCDGWKKHLELIRYSEYLKPNDVIMCHDYGHDLSDFQRNASTIGWPNINYESCYAQISSAVAANGLVPYEYDAFKRVMWGSFMRSDTAPIDSTDHRVITIVDSYMSSPEIVHLTCERITALKKAGHTVMLITNTPPPSIVSHLVDYCIYDSNNRLFDTTKFEYQDLELWFGCAAIQFHTMVSNVQRHGLSVLRNMFTALGTARSLGYTHFQRIEVDDAMSDTAMEHIKNVPAMCDRAGKFGLFYRNADDISFHYFYCEIQHFLRHVTTVTTTEEYLDFLQKTYGNNTFKLVENYVFKHIENSQGILFMDNAAMKSHFDGTIWNTVSSEANVPVHYHGCMTNLYRHLNQSMEEQPTMVLITRNFTNDAFTRFVVIDGVEEIRQHVTANYMAYHFNVINVKERIDVYDENHQFLYTERVDSVTNWATI